MQFVSDDMKTNNYHVVVNIKTKKSRFKKKLVF